MAARIVRGNTVEIQASAIEINDWKFMFGLNGMIELFFIVVVAVIVYAMKEISLRICIIFNVVHMLLIFVLFSNM